MDPNAMIYMLHFITTASGIPKLIEGDKQIQREHGDPLSLLLFFKRGK
jgi:hypothetical protein